MLCMMAHEDKISDACYDAVLTVTKGVDRAIVKVHRAEATDLEARAKK